MTVITNDVTGQEIHLEDTDDLQKLENQWNLLGMNGLAYSPWANKIQEKIKKIKDTSLEEKAPK